MPIRHREQIADITEVRVVPDGELLAFEIDLVTRGGVLKTLCVPYCDASWLRGRITDEIKAIPLEERKRSLFGGLLRKKRK